MSKTIQEYAQQFDWLPTSKLLEIVSDQTEYDKNAVAAAKIELEKRESEGETTDNEMNNFRVAEIEHEVFYKLKRKILTSCYKINPFDSNLSLDFRLYRFVGLVLSILFAISIVWNIRSVISILLSSDELDSYFFICKFQIIISSMSIFLYWKRSFIGWMILTISAQFIISLELFSILYALVYMPSAYFTDLLYFNLSETGFAFILNTGLIVYFFLRKTREIFGVSKKIIILNNLTFIILLVVFTILIVS